MARDETIGRAVTIGAIGAVIVAALLVLYSGMTVLTDAVTPATGVIASVILVLCGHLYTGSSWARWIVGGLLVLLGAGQTLQATTAIPARVTLLFTVWLGGAILIVSFGTALLILKPVGVFLNSRKANRTPLVRRVLRALWLVTGLAAVVAIVGDVAALFRY